MASEPDRHADVKVNTSAGVAGAGGGTLLVLIASKLSDGDPLKIVLLAIAPTTTLIFRGATLWLQKRIYERYQKYELRRTIEQARKTLDQALKDPHLRAKERIRLISMRKELDTMYLESQIKHVRVTLSRQSTDYPDNH